jgi:phage shock protein PspC (stress-responsive transcriptional regulator)
MRVFPSERDRQRSDLRTVRLFFVVMAVVTCAYAIAVVVHRLLASW